MIINGKEMQIETPINISQLLSKLELDPKTVVVEVNMEIVQKGTYEGRLLNEKDKIEIVSFLGGGWLIIKIVGGYYGYLHKRKENISI